MRPTLFLTARLGAFFWNADTKVTTGPGISAKIDEDGTDLTWGVGMLFNLTEQLGAWLQYDRFRVDDDWIGLYALGLSYRF